MCTNRCAALASLVLAICASYPASASPQPSPMEAPPLVHTLTPPLRRGDLVRLRSGGPMMTVSVVGDGKIECFWTDVNGQTDDATFPADVLQKF